MVGKAVVANDDETPPPAPSPLAVPFKFMSIIIVIRSVLLVPSNPPPLLGELFICRSSPIRSSDLFRSSLSSSS